jgi:hypothetical protein
MVKYSHLSDVKWKKGQFRAARLLWDSARVVFLDNYSGIQAIGSFFCCLLSHYVPDVNFHTGLR